MWRALVALAVVLAVTGCVAAPTATESGTPAADREIHIEGGSLPVDGNRVFDRVRALLGADVDPPQSVRVADAGTLRSRPAPEPPSRFWVAMNVTPAPGGRLNLTTIVTGATTGLGRIVIYPGDNESAVIHYVLAHEFVHYVQLAEKRDVQLTGEVDLATTDGRFVVRAVLEGVAVYATDEYIDRHVDADVSNSGLYREIQSRLPRGGLRWYGNAQYVHGTRYVAARLDDPGRADRVYARPPTTSEQVIHRLQPGAEPPANLSVRVESGTWEGRGTDRMGEAFLRVALQSRLSPSVARRAAAGWGNDALRTFRDGSSGRRAFAWVLRWDDPENASEFADAFGRYLDARGTRANGTWAVGNRTFDLRRMGTETTLVVIGPGSFVRGTNATVSGDAVLLRLPRESENESGGE